MGLLGEFGGEGLCEAAGVGVARAVSAAIWGGGLVADYY